MKILKVIGSIVLTEVVGGLSGLFTIQAIPTWYATLNKPAFSPPNWLFGPTWTILYALMGIALYLLWRDRKTLRRARVVLGFFFAQLVLNFFWSIIFFALHQPGWALVEILVLLAAIIGTMVTAWRAGFRSVTYLFIPYLLWVSFATLLTFAVFRLN
ncbi:MAG: TspO/MBR family protein [Candidatus Andersenbacteria bacterium]